MRLVKVGICNIDTKVKAFEANARKAVAMAKQAAAEGYNVICFPEQTFFGYSPEDLVEWTHLVKEQLDALNYFIGAMDSRDDHQIYVVGATIPVDSNLYNCAVVIQGHRIVGVVPKQELPNYNVFYERRNFTSGKAGQFIKSLEAFTGYDVPFGDLVFDFDFGRMAVEVCEDIWSSDGPMKRRCHAGAELVINISASPYRIGVLNTRREMISTRAGDNNAVVAYTNLIGGNDGLIFDGGGFISNCGKLVHEAPRWKEGLSGCVVDLDTAKRKRIENMTWRSDRENDEAAKNINSIRYKYFTERSELKYPVPRNQSFFIPDVTSTNDDFIEDILSAITWGLKGYYEKCGAFKTIVIALSGGRDSLLALIVARRYVDMLYPDLPKEQVDLKAKEIIRTIYMPTKFSSKDTENAADLAADACSSKHRVSSIQDEFELALKKHQEMLPIGVELSRANRQNIQARIRAERMWTLTNSLDGMYIQTGNMTEKVMGYLTMGGDSEGALAIISNLPKSLINYMLTNMWRQRGSLIDKAIEATLAKPASAELDDNQEDEKDMLPYPNYDRPKDSFKIIDALIYLMIGEKMSRQEASDVLVEMFPEHTVDYLTTATKTFEKMFIRNIFKWKQSPTSLHLGNLDLDHSRALQLPVIQENKQDK